MTWSSRAFLVRDDTRANRTRGLRTRFCTHTHSLLLTRLAFDFAVGTDGVQFNIQIHIKELLVLRSERLALLQTTFPPIHWMSMGLLGASIVVCFLLETDEKALQFLDFLQLRILFTILIGSLSGIAAICVDLNDPFSGSFRITPSAHQLHVIRALAQAELADVHAAADAEQQQQQQHVQHQTMLSQ